MQPPQFQLKFVPGEDIPEKLKVEPILAQTGLGLAEKALVC
jgi:hypothetical protein